MDKETSLGQDEPQDVRHLRAQEEGLRAWFKKQELDPDAIHAPPPDLERRVATLLNLASWVCAWGACADRRKMEAKGFDYPPVEPRVNPEADWLRFERWVKGESLRWSLAEAVRTFESPESLSEEVASALAERITQLLAGGGVEVFLPSAMPPRVRYACLLRTAREETFDFVAPGTRMALGCDGYCPGCLQRPWCAEGQESDWPEDEDAGGMAIPEEAKKLMNLS